jgi:glycosyl transferase family 1
MTRRGGTDLAIAVGPCLRTGMWKEIVAAVQAAAGEIGERSRIVEDVRGTEASKTLILGVAPWPRIKVPPSRRTKLIGWFAEPLPPAAGRSLRHRALAAFPSARLIDLGLDILPERRLTAAPTRRLHSLREVAAGEREWRRNAQELRALVHVVDDVVVTSEDRRLEAARLGIAARRVPYGYHPAHAGTLTLLHETGRDLAVVVLGRDTSGRTRRARVLSSVSAALGDRLQPTILEGLFQQQRHDLLRRAAVVLDVHRVPGNFIGLRLLLAIAAGAVVVTETIRHPEPFIPGTHFVQAPADELAQTVRQLVADTSRRRRIVEAGQDLLTSSLTMERSLQEVLGR